MSLWMLLALASILAACARTPPEEQLRESVAVLQSAIEKHDGPAVQNMLADDFIGPEGLDRNGARRLAQAMFLRYRDVSVTLGPLDIEIRPEHAIVRFTAALTGGAGALPESGQVYDVETSWRMEDGDWRLVNAAWKPRV